MAFTEFCCRSGGSNMNGGCLNSNAEPATTPVYSFTNGGWNSGTGVYTPTSGNPSSTVTVGDFASVFLDGATTPVFIGRVTAVNSTTVTVSTSVKVGTAPTTAGTGISINVGGAWAGPSGAVKFPFDFITTALTNVAGNRPRVNFKNAASFVVSASMTVTNNNSIRWQGYSTTFADGGKATFDGGTTGASYAVLDLQNSTGYWFEDFIFTNNGATGSSSLVQATTGGNSWPTFRRCVFMNSVGAGLGLTQSPSTLVIECEAYNCNTSNTAGISAFYASVAATFIRCYSHDHVSGANKHGFGTGGRFIECIADTCSGSGWAMNSNSGSIWAINCEAYNCGVDGLVDVSNGGITEWYIENFNAVKNGGWGINLGGAGGGTLVGYANNCGFGAGTQANTSGTINTPTGSGHIDVNGSVTYASGVTPWSAPATGDFRIALATAKNAGRGGFTQTQGGKTGTVAYPDIGAAQHLDAGGSSGPLAQLKTFGRGSPY